MDTSDTLANYVPTFDISSKVILITGANRGIGKGLAMGLAGLGATIIASARKLEDSEQLCDTISRLGGQAIPLELDVSSVAKIEKTALDIHGRYDIDILINNAGLGVGHGAVDITEEDWDGMHNVNLKGLFFCCQTFGRKMLERGEGCIINISSQLGEVGLPGSLVYCSTKGGVNQITRVLGLEWGGLGVRVNAIAPTFIETDGTLPILRDPDRKAEILSNISLGKTGLPKDVTSAAVYLASDAGGLVNGTVSLC